MNTNNEEKIVLIDNNDILPNRFQPRKTFSENDLLDLTETIKKYGILEPIIVRPLSDKYELVAGERRYKANVLAGNDNIPSIIKNLSDAECAEIAIIENSQRQDLSPLEEAISYKRTIDLGYDTQQKLAEKIGKSQSYIANKIRLLKLSDEVQDALLNNKISERHARSLLKINSLNQQNEMLNRIINERLTVRRTDEEIDKMNNENINNEQLQTTPLNTIFNNRDNSQAVNENSVFSFGPEQSTTESSEKPLMSFDLNGNPLDNNNSASVPPISNIPEAAPTMEAAPQPVEQPQPFNMFNAGPEVAPTPTMEAAPQPVEQPQPFNMFNAGPEIAPTPTMEAAPQPVEQPQPFNMFNAGPEVAPTPTMEAAPQPVEQPQPFNMFNAGPEVAPTPTMETAPQPVEQPQPFNMFNAGPEIAPTPTMEAAPQPVEQPQPFNMFNAGPEKAPTPTMEAAPQPVEQPQPFNMFNAGPEVAPAPTMEAAQPFRPTNSSIPQTPIFNSSDDTSIAEFKKPDPIIVTDYSKEYDPVMPQSQQPKMPDIDMKTIINIIRQCSDTIEKCGYTIETEEYDLENIYQVVFKINKN